MKTTEEDFDDIHDCDLCRWCSLKEGCQTDPNFGCQKAESVRRMVEKKPRTVTDDVDRT